MAYSLPVRAATPSTPKPPAAQWVVQYVGFQDTDSRREYSLLAQRGDKARRYTVWIAQAAFSRRQALLQDGPDICYQKLLRALAEFELAGTARIGVTDGDLSQYRNAHLPAARRPTPRRVAAAADPGESA